MKKIVIIFFIIILNFSIYSQKYKRWRLKFECEPPKTITIVEPDKTKKSYWYVIYKVINDTNRDIPWMVNIRLVIDKVRNGVPETKVPGLFYNCQIPDNVNKEEYLNNLQNYFDIDLPIVKREIYKQLRIYPHLSPNEKKVLSILKFNKPMSILKIMKKAELSYEETEKILIKLVVNNLAISQEIKGNPIFIKGKMRKALFLYKGKKVTLKKGDKIAGWELLSFTKDRVLMKKNGIITKFCKGATLEYLYSKTDKVYVERDPYYLSGMEAKGVFKGIKLEDGKEEYIFKNRIIKKKSIVNGIAIFSNVSNEADFIAVVVSGLIDPIVRKKGKLYLDNEIFMCAYKRPGDEFEVDRDKIIPLFKRWIILSSKEIKRK